MHCEYFTCWAELSVLLLPPPWTPLDGALEALPDEPPQPVTLSPRAMTAATSSPALLAFLGLSGGLPSTVDRIPFTMSMSWSPSSGSVLRRQFYEETGHTTVREPVTEL
jgi:hypothetical protein